MSGSNPDELEIMLGGNHYRLDSPLQFTGVKTFPGKTVTGDYSLDSNPLLSSWVISDYTGGNGARDLNEATDTNRYSYGDINTRFPKQFTLPFQYTYRRYGLTTDYYAPLGNMYINSTQKVSYFSSLDTDLRMDEVSLGTTALAGRPTRQPGTVFAGTGTEDILFIPLGDAGYATYRPSTNALINHSGAGPYFKAMVKWADRLVGVDRDGQLWYTTTVAGGWTSYGATGRLVSGAGGRAMAVYVNASGDPAIHILGDTGVWIFDAAGPKLWQTPIQLPPHPQVWNAFCVWRGDLYIGVGMDLIQWNGSVQRNIGPSRDDGLPHELQGRIIDIRPELNSLYALVQGTNEDGTKSGYVTVQEWSGYGWRGLPMAKQGTLNDATMIGIMASDTLGYQLVCGFRGGPMNCISYYLPQNFTNPRQALAAGTIPFGANAQSPFIQVGRGDAYFETGRFDANMQGYVKLAASLTATFAGTSDLDSTADFFYRTDANDAYTSLGTINGCAPGRYVFDFGTADADGNSPGMPFEYIELKVVLAAGEVAYYTPVLQNMVMSFQKIVAQSYSWVANITLQAPYKGRSPQVLLDEIKAIAAQTDWLTMKHRNQTYRVEISAIDGQENLAKDERSIVRISILEIPRTIGSGEISG